MRALIVDDERLARTELARLLLADGRAVVVGQAASVAAAAALADRLNPDVVFLDVRLGRASGFDLLPHLDESTRVVFVTAHDEYAVRAFRAAAVDYLLKPVAPRHLGEALARISGRIRPPVVEDTRPLTIDDWIFLGVGRDRVFTRVGDISHLVVRGDDVRVFVPGGAAIRSTDPLGHWEARLPAGFIRSHRSAIVNLSHVARVEPWSHGTYRLWMRGCDEPLPLARRQAARVHERLR